MLSHTSQSFWISEAVTVGCPQFVLHIWPLGGGGLQSQQHLGTSYPPKPILYCWSSSSQTFSLFHLVFGHLSVFYPSTHFCFPPQFSFWFLFKVLCPPPCSPYFLPSSATPTPRPPFFFLALASFPLSPPELIPSSDGAALICILIKVFGPSDESCSKVGVINMLISFTMPPPPIHTHPQFALNASTLSKSSI